MFINGRDIEKKESLKLKTEENWHKLWNDNEFKRKKNGIIHIVL